MKIKIISIFFLIIFFSCQEGHNRKGSENLEIFIVTNSNQQNDSLNNTKNVYREFYSDLNIIFIDSIPEIYYHRKRIYCLTGSEPNNTLPFFRNLKPEYFKTSQSTLELRDLVLKENLKHKRIYLISNKDTIRDKRYFDLKNKLIDKGILTSTRTLTEEETVIICQHVGIHLNKSVLNLSF